MRVAPLLAPLWFNVDSSSGSSDFSGPRASCLLAPVLARRFSRRHHRGDDPGEQSGKRLCLRAAATLRMEWLDADRPDLSLLPLYCGRVAGFVVSLAR